jgi:hypothetical protein
MAVFGFNLLAELLDHWFNPWRQALLAQFVEELEERKEGRTDRRKRTLNNHGRAATSARSEHDPSQTIANLRH